jgi:hypothetical protein
MIGSKGVRSRHKTTHKRSSLVTSEVGAGGITGGVVIFNLLLSINWIIILR